jgi:hypothetical protein
VTRGWIKLHLEEPQNLYSSPNIIRMIKWNSTVGDVAHVGKIRNVYESLVRKLERTRPLGKPINKI